MSIIIPANSAVAGGYDVANGIRLDNNAYLSRTFSEAGAGGGGGTFKWTLSLWFKRSLIDGNEHVLMSRYVNSGKYVTIKINGNNKIEYRVYNGGDQCRMTTSAVLRDPSAWMHFVIAQDTTLGTAGNRVKFFIGGSRVTAFDTNTEFSQNVGGDFNTASPHQIGAYNGADEFQGYMGQICFVDNVQYDADQFGEFDEDSGIWKPIDVSGLSTGATSFFLAFEDSSALGTDSSGDSNNFSLNNIAATDQTTDTCTNNFATLNSVDNYYPRATLSEGNLLQVSDTYAGTNTGEVAPNTSTIGVSNGKWYAEMKYVSTAQHSYGRPGITSNQNGPGNGTSVLGSIPGSWGMFLASGSLYNGNGDTSTSYGSEVNVGDIVGMYMDLDNNKLYYADNGTLVSSTGISITAAASTNLGAYFFGNSDESRNTATFGWNFGGCSAFTVSSGNTDVNGYGNFEYDPSSGTFDGASKDFLAVCTKNLAEHG